MTAGGGARWVCGRLGKAHGLAGELYVDLAPGGLEYLAGGERFFVADEKGGEERPCAVRRAGGSDARPLVTLDLAASREEAIALQGLTLLASGGPLDALPHYRVGDLLGRPVRDGGSGAVLGEVSDVLSAPTHEILELRPPDGGAPVLVPLVEELVWEDGAGGLTVRAGLLEGQQRRPAGASGDADHDEGPGREDG
ncbi:MAG TPA: PRC-barrel domain-containing protein, partial [Thermoleophilia bacterium]|nr:PRC-barrel domain-containing protein [Thermoleophilia bacterium]